jgi:predicted nucleic acid-binding protein
MAGLSGPWRRSRVIVVDAGAWVEAEVDKGPIGNLARQVLSDDPDWSAPAHAAIEALRTIRRYQSAVLIAVEHAETYAAEVREVEVRYAGQERRLLARGLGSAPQRQSLRRAVRGVGLSITTFVL